MTKLAINGLGRIGRAFLKLALERPEFDVVAVNDLADPDNLVYLLRFDSVYGRYAEPVSIEDLDGETHLVVGEHWIPFLRQHDPAALPWAALDVDVVVEATGVVETFEKAGAHRRAG